LAALLLICVSGAVFLAFYLTRQTDFLLVREIYTGDGTRLVRHAHRAGDVNVASIAFTPSSKVYESREVVLPLKRGLVHDSDCRLEIAPGARVVLSIINKGRLYVEAPSNARARIRIFARSQDWWRLDEGRAWLIGRSDKAGQDRELARLRFDLAVDREEIAAGGILSLQLHPHNPEHISRIGGALGDAPLLFFPSGDGLGARVVRAASGENGENGENGALGACDVPFMTAFAGIDCAIEDDDQRLAIWSFGQKGSWYMRSWRLPLKPFEANIAARDFFVRNARPFPRGAYPPLPRDWRQRWIEKRDEIMSDDKPAQDGVRLQAIFTNAVPLGLSSIPADGAFPLMPELRAPLVIPMEQYDRVSSPFGVVRHLTSTNGRAHRGIDFASPEGVSVRTPWPGKVVFADAIHTGGNTVIVHHGMGIFSCFMHLSAFRVQTGASLRAGQTVGLVGTTGLSTGPHLHYDLRVGNRAVDPSPYFIRSPFARDPVWKTLPR
jgi:hypothetical protein